MKTTTISRLTSISLATLMLAGVSLNAIATPATTQPATQLAQATAKKRLVVMDFDYGTTNSYYTSYRGVGAAKGISELLINELVNNGTYTVVDVANSNNCSNSKIAAVRWMPAPQQKLARS